jgi:predicted dehydrogenase
MAMRFIQVGVGGFGRVWVNCLKNHPEAQCVGLVDVREPALKAACESAGYSLDMCFPTLPDALARVSADAVVCVTPPQHHRGAVVEAMRAGLHVISEKPMADTPEDCRAILQAAVDTGRTCVVSQNYRYNDVTSTLADLVRAGTIGAVGQVTVDFHMGVDFGGGFRHEMEYPLLIDMSIHHFDLIRYVTGLNAVDVSGTAWNPPWSNYRGACSNCVVFAMDNGARVVYNGSWCAKGQFNDWNGNWTVQGDRGTLVYRDGKIRLYDVPERYKVEAQRTVRKRKLARHGQDFVLTDFIEAIRAGRRPRTDVYDNIRSVSMVFAAVDAVRSGRQVRVLAADVEAMLQGH